MYISNVSFSENTFELRRDNLIEHNTNLISTSRFPIAGSFDSEFIPRVNLHVADKYAQQLEIASSSV